MRSLHHKWLPFSLVILMLFLQYHLWFDTGGVLDMLHFKKKLTQQLKKNSQLKKRNEHLLQEIQSLQSNESAIESHARQDLGMVKKGEIFYQIIE